MKKQRQGKGYGSMGLSCPGLRGCGTYDPGHPHGGGQGAGLWGAICLPSCPEGASQAARHTPLGTEPWEADLIQSQAIRLSEKYCPHGYDRFYLQDNTSDTKRVAFPHQPPTVQTEHGLGCPAVPLSADGDAQSQPRAAKGRLSPT